MKKYIVCCGTNGRCVIAGDAEEEPVVGSPCRLTNARMILYWSRGGLLGVAANGVPEGSRLTAAVPATVTSPVTEWIAATEAAARSINQWPAC